MRTTINSLQIIQTSPLQKIQKQINQPKSKQCQLANWDKALVHKQSMMPGKVDDYGLVQPFSLDCDLNDLKDYGIGLFFFFSFLKTMTIFFFIASLFTIPSLYSNFTGKGMQVQGITILQQFSIANQPQLSPILPSQNSTKVEIQQIQQQNDKLVEDFVEKMNERKYWIWIPDIAYSGLFLIFLLYYRIHSAKHQNLYYEENINPSRYALELKGFPSTTTNPNEIKNFLNKVFSDFSKDQQQNQQVIVEVSLARNFYGTLFLHQEESILLEKIELDEEKQKIGYLDESGAKQLNKNRKQLHKIQTEIDQIIKEKLNNNLRFEEYESIKAYVVFETFEYRKKAFVMYNKYNYGWIRKYIICCCRAKMPEEMKFKNEYELVFSQSVDLPSNIKWENIEVQGFNKFKRKIITFLIILIVLNITIFIVVVANILKPEQQNCETIDMDLNKVKQQNNDHVKACFCVQQNIKDIFQNGVLRDYCYEQYIQYVITMSMIFFCSFVIVIVNTLLKLIIKALTRFIRYPTFSQESSVTVILLFTCTFINTSIIVLILQADIYGFILSIFITNPIPPLKELQEKKTTHFQNDFTRKWYQDVGSNIIITMLITIISPHLINMLFLPCRIFFTNRRAKQQILQVEMNKNILGPQFDLVSSYATSLNVIFTCLFYSSGQPLLLLIGFLSLFFQYWCYKYQLIRYCQKPAQYDQKINDNIIKILPFALAFHLGIGIYMYGHPLIFPQDENEVKIKVLNNLDQQGYYQVNMYTNQNQIIENRAFQYKYLFYFLLSILGIISIDIILYPIIKFLFIPSDQNSNDDQKVYSKEMFEKYSYKNQIKQMQAKMIASYDMSQNSQYNGIVKAINDGSHKFNSIHVLSPQIQTNQNLNQDILNKKSLFGIKPPKYTKIDNRLITEEK